MNVLVNNIPTHYRDEGNGPVILMLHGWGSDLTSFDSLATWAKDKYRVLRLDLPGFGKTPFTVDGSWRLDDYIKFVTLFLNKLDIDKLDVILGHSMGGRIAMKAVGNNALKPEKVILLASHGLSEKSTRKTMYKLTAKIGKAATLVLPKRQREKLKRRLYKSAGSDDYINASEEMKGTFKNLVNEDLKDSAARITKPTLLVYGTEDTTTPLEMGEVFAEQIEGSSLRVIKGAGHYIHVDAFDEVTKAIKEFLK